MSRWFRTYDDALDDPKVQSLPGEMFKAWFNLLCVTSKNDGRPFDVKEIAFRLRTTPAKAQKIADEFVRLGLLDVTDDRYVSHNWAGRQFKSDVSNERVKRYRERQRNVTPAVTATPPDTDTETETERKKDAPSARVTEEADLFRRGKEILGGNSGGLIKQLLQAKGGNIALARAAIETATAKHNPREYIAGCIRGDPKDDARARGDAW